jgi:uncharacterized membrane protein
MILFYVFWVSASILAGLLGRKRKFGFWGYLFASIFFTPIVGLVLLLGSDPKVLPESS